MFNNELWQKPADGAGGDFYSYQIAHSLRFPTGANGYLSNTSLSAGNRRTWTYSIWTKKNWINNTTNGERSWLSGYSTGGATYVFWGFQGHSSNAAHQDDFKFEETSGSTQSAFSIDDGTNERKFRDPSAWYHVVLAIDTTQSTATNRQKLWINGEAQTLAVSTQMAQDYEFSFVNNGTAKISYLAWSNGLEDTQLADYIFLDGVVGTADTFGEFHNGVWRPVEYSGSYGDEGYHLKFSDSSDIGKDYSGNSNNFTVNNLSAHDQMLDTPTFNSNSNGGNFPTYNPLLKPPSGLALSEGNLKATLTSDDNGIMTNWQVPLTGKWYWEIDIDNIATDHGVYVGVMPANTDLTINQEQNDLGLVYYSINGNSILKGTRSSYGDTWTTGDIISIAVDRDADTLQFYKNGSGQGTISISTLDEEFFCYMGYTGGSGPCSTILNFGQDGTFAGNVTAGGNSDGTGYGNFKYSVPSGFLAMCSGNLPIADAINPAETDDNFPSQLFDAQLWTGDGNSGRSITISGAKKPSLSVIKQRNSSNGWNVWTQGYNSGDYDSFGEFNSDGAWNANQGSNGPYTADPTASALTLTAYGQVNGSSNTYVNYRWVANGGTTSSDASGDITSVGEVDPSGCFSVVTYTGSGTGNQTVAHHLSQAPIAAIFKRTDGTKDWMFTAGTSYMNDQYMSLNDGAAAQGGLYQGGRSFTANAGASLMTLENATEQNGSGYSMLAYFFSNCEGYIKVGEYVGNGNADGSFVYTGFKPAFVMVKYTGSGESWVVLDDERDGYNVTNKNLRANSTNAEASGSTYNIDFLSNGFKPRTTWEGLNGSGYTIVFLAMAKNPFKYATAR
tara:strand:- start:5314 stop:7836 length:2523 start_codon:yes stop_codon:yes gene_type:complete